MIALNLGRLVLERPAGAALVLQLLKRPGQIVAFVGQAANQSDNLAFFAFLNCQPGGLLLGRNTRWRLGRAVALFLKLAATVTTWRNVKLCSFE